MDHNFKGWVPTVTGRLSFSLIRGNEEGYNCNLNTNINRFVIGTSKRYLSDSVLPKFIIRHLLNHEPDYWFVCLASSGNDPANSSDSLEGKIFIFDNKLRWQQINAFIKNKVDLLEKSSDDDLNTIFNRIVTESDEHLLNQSLSACDFVLKRNGITELRISQDILEKTSPEAPKISVNSKGELENIKNRCAQMFFFLKDLTHIHQHHASSMDTLVTVYPVIDNKDCRWKSETLRVLQRKILEYKRLISRDSNGGVHSIRDSALGTLSYMKSFIQICDDEDNKKPEPLWNIEFLESSILAAQESQKNKLQAQIRAVEVSQNWFLGLLSLIFSFVGIGALIGTFTKIEEIKKIDAHWIYTDIISFVLEKPIAVLTLLIFCVVFIYIKVNFVNIKRNYTIRNFIRALQVFKQKNSVILIFGLSGLNICIVYLLLKLINHLN
jgi:hypothetical protein